jgi:hypothetical protein
MASSGSSGSSATKNIVPAIQREKSLKKYRREWKINLIEAMNPHWHDLFPSLLHEEGPLSDLSWREQPMPERPSRNPKPGWGKRSGSS